MAMRGVAIIVGVALIERFHIVTYILGALLLVLAWRMYKGAADHVDPDHSPLVRLIRRFYPIGDYHGSRFSTIVADRRVLTPLALALVSVVAADIVITSYSIHYTKLYDEKREPW